jgi:hypothetical protein
MKISRLILLACIILGVNSCSSLVLKPADFSWPVETVLTTDQIGMVVEERYSFSLNVSQMIIDEFGENTDISSREIRILRNADGYYFITGPSFKNVYVFESQQGELKLYKKIFINYTGLQSPAMNQRTPYIELLDGENKYLLSNSGIEG